MYCKIFNGFKQPTTQAYCCFSCCTAINDAVFGMKKITGIYALKHNKHEAYCCFSCCTAISEAVSERKKITGQSALTHIKHVVSGLKRTQTHEILVFTGVL
jgi:hypothetical protein